MATSSLCLKFCNLAADLPCALCGECCDPEVGPEVFVEGTNALVCDACALARDPMLYLFRHLLYESAHDWWTESEQLTRSEYARWQEIKHLMQTGWSETDIARLEALLFKNPA